jgi:hypothetical protein
MGRRTRPDIRQKQEEKRGLTIYMKAWIVGKKEEIGTFCSSTCMKRKGFWEKRLFSPLSLYQQRRVSNYWLILPRTPNGSGNKVVE